MTFRTYYTVNTVGEEIENVESFESNGDFLRIEYYPNVDWITNDVIHREPEVKHIPMDAVIDIEEREVRF
jgi:hypothetical protein